MIGQLSDAETALRASVEERNRLAQLVADLKAKLQSQAIVCDVGMVQRLARRMSEAELRRQELQLRSALDAVSQLIAAASRTQRNDCHLRHLHGRAQGDIVAALPAHVRLCSMCADVGHARNLPCVSRHCEQHRRSVCMRALDSWTIPRSLGGACPDQITEEAIQMTIREA